MTEEEFQKEMDEHAKRIEKAEREDWFMKPIPLSHKASLLRMDQMRIRMEWMRNG